MILIDTDVLIDVALDRHPHTVASSELLDRIENGSEDASIAWHSVSNLYYLVSPSLGGISTRDFIVELTRFVGVAPADAESIRYAAALPMDDFEDAMQVAAARACGARHIVTRNLRDYERSPIPAVGTAGSAGRTVLSRAQTVRRSIVIFSTADSLPYETIHHGSSR